jgi:hypothetical protein
MLVMASISHNLDYCTPTNRLETRDVVIRQDVEQFAPQSPPYRSARQRGRSRVCDIKSNRTKLSLAID